MPTSTVGKTPSPRPSRRQQQGFTYALVLVAVLVVGILAQRAETSSAQRAQVDREQELLFRGQAYRQAIARFHAALGRYPRTLDELLQDPRAHRPYLRQLYREPMSAAAAPDAKADATAGWRLLRAADGGIAGVASRSEQEPIKKAHFPVGLEAFEGAPSYAQWVFEHRPVGASPVLKRRRPCERVELHSSPGVFRLDTDVANAAPSC